METTSKFAKNSRAQTKVLIVDLNNFPTFPTLSIGILTATLRKANFETKVLLPLAHDAPAAERERRENFVDHWKRVFHLSNRSGSLWLRNSTRKIRAHWNSRPHPRVLKETKRALDDQPDILLISTYLQHYQTVFKLGCLAKKQGIPLLLGGPVFNLQKTVETWSNIPGLTAIVGAEVDLSLPDIVVAAIEGKDLLKFKGVMLPDGRCSPSAEPLRDIDSIPIPDFTDFFWDRYRIRIIPVMAGRGCQWAECVFCSDIQSVNGRMFRPRSAELVLREMEEQAKRHQTTNFLFLDLKLNSYPALWRGIIEGIQQHIPEAQWIGTVHVDIRKDNGLQDKDLRAAVAAGMRRVSFGLESGSQRLLDMMKKGATVEENSRFIRDAHAAGLSIRCTMFSGFPGETAEDLELTASFLQKHVEQIDRIRFNDFSIHEGSAMYDEIVANTNLYPEIKVVSYDNQNARLNYREITPSSKKYKQALRKTLAIVHAINKKPVRSEAREFDGLM